MAAGVVGSYHIERAAGEAIAAFDLRITNLLATAVLAVEADTTIKSISYHKPTFSIQTLVVPGAGAATVVVALDRAAGEVIGNGSAAVGADAGFTGRIRAALGAGGAGLTSLGTCFQTAAVAALPPEFLYDPPTFMCLYTALGAGVVVEVQGTDNLANTNEAAPVADVAPGAWTTGLLWTVPSKAGHTIFIGN